MKRGLLVLAVAATVVFGGTPAQAHDEYRFVGRILSVESTKNRFSLRFKEADGKDETVWIALKATTDITRDRKPVPRSELKAGLNVVVDALGDDYDTLEAEAVRIVPPPSTK